MSNGDPSTSCDPSGPRRIILCFDGTGNHFQGNESDTNIVKIYQMLDRHTPGQFHYYQPGIGTYIKHHGPSSSFFSKIKSGITKAIDQGVGSSFRSHVLAGYRFVMRYYLPGDHIYIFGFSRGAYTARFLAEMIHGLGLLSQGNEEMVHFAWKTFSDYQHTRGDDHPSEKDRELERYMHKFKNTYCRRGVGVHFLGLFDCVNSVGQFEIPFWRTSYRCIASPSARYIRHAVSIHERRLKFKPALFIPDSHGPPLDLKEVWFAGNHCDIGGGYRLEKGQRHLLSDTPLNWMIQEVLNLEGSESKLSFQTVNVESVKRSETTFFEHEHGNGNAFTVKRCAHQPHDTLRFGGGSSCFMVIFWWILEILPIFTRLELINGKWIPRRLPPNLGAYRDLPSDANIHPSVQDMLQTGVLEQQSMPKPGGEHAVLPDMADITETWTNAARTLARKASNLSLRSEGSGRADGNEDDGAANSWSPV